MFVVCPLLVVKDAPSTRAPDPTFAPMDLSLRDRRAVICGSTQGIGAAAALCTAALKDFPLPVRTIGPGSQQDEGDELLRLAMFAPC